MGNEHDQMTSNGAMYLLVLVIFNFILFLYIFMRKKRKIYQSFRTFGLCWLTGFFFQFCCGVRPIKKKYIKMLSFYKSWSSDWSV
jgi:hypothetical protein